MKNIYRAMRIYKEADTGIEVKTPISFFLEDVITWEGNRRGIFEASDVVTLVDFVKSDPVYILIDFKAFDLLMDKFNNRCPASVFNTNQN